jgi:carbonic anhydrase
MKMVVWQIVFVVTFAALLGGTCKSEAEDKPTSPNEALQQLLEGNKRFVAHSSTHSHDDEARLREIEAEQRPIAVVLSCSDSRVPPELIFDQGLGDLFVIRVAGNVTDDAVIGSIEYAVEHLGVTLVVVLGHQGCGAVQAAVNGSERGNHIHSFVDAIAPVVPAAKITGGDPVDACVRLNVSRVVGEIKQSEPVLAESVRTSKVRIVGAYYSLHTGAVSIVPEGSAEERNEK